MKTILLTIAAFVTIAGNVIAQDNSTDLRERAMIGFKIGANYSNVYDSDGDAFVADPKFGFATGAFFSIPLDKYFGLQPEILFSQKGFKATGMLLNDDYNLTRTTSYIDVPLFLTLKPSEFFTVLAGPQFSYLIHQKDVISTGTNSVLQEQEFERDNIRKNMLCFVAGSDITIKHAVIGTRIGWDVLNNKGDGTSNTPRYKNVWYQLTLGYRLY